MIRYYKANMAGPYHLDNDIPCQDSYFIQKDDNGVVYASVADGLGSELHSDVGSHIASQKVCEFCMQNYKSGMPFSDVRKIMNNAFVSAYRAVLEEARSAGNPSDEYDTTLCLVIFDSNHVYYGQSGDSGILALMQSGEYVPLTTQQRDEDGYVFPLCSGPNMWVFGEVEAPVSSIMLMTDGVWEQICPPMLRNQEVKVNVALTSKFMDRRETSVKSVKALEKAAYKYLENYPRRLLDDDKTIVVIYNPLHPAKKLSAEYYKAPDWVSLREAATSNLYSTVDPTGEESEFHETGGKPDGNEEDLAVSDKKDSETDIVAFDSAEEVPYSKQNSPKSSNDPFVSVVKTHQSGSCEPRNRHSKHYGSHEATTKKKGASPMVKMPAGGLYNFLSVLLLLTFSIAAFAMNGFVKEHAPTTYFGVFLVCFIANSTVLLPAPSILIVLQYSMLLNPIIVATCGALGASLGEMVGFMAGAHGGHFVSRTVINKIEKLFPRHPYLFVVAFSALPLPLFDIVGMLAGAIRLNKIKFYATCLAGKLIKMLMFVWMGQVVAKLIT